MSERRCEQCNTRLVSHRADARFCDELCRARFNNKRRSANAASDIRIEGGSGGEGSRGGDVRSVQDARDLQRQQKAKRDWGDAIDEQIRRTLTQTGFFHADDLDALGVPPEHCNLKGTRAAWFRNKRYMESTDVYRKVSHPAANGRKAPIYRITKVGRERLVGVGVGGSAHAGGDASTDPGEKPAGVEIANREGTAGASLAHATGTLDRPGGISTPATSNGARSSSGLHPGGQPDPSTSDASSNQDGASGRPARHCVADGQSTDGSPAADRSSLAAAGESRPTLFEVAEEMPKPLNPLADREAA